MERMFTTNWPRTAGRLIGFIVSVLSVILMAFGLFGDIGLDTGGFLMLSLAAMALASCIVSYWRLRLAGILLVLISIAFGVQISVYAIDNHFFAWVIMGFPYLVAGALMILGWWLERKG